MSSAPWAGVLDSLGGALDVLGGVLDVLGGVLDVLNVLRVLDVLGPLWPHRGGRMKVEHNGWSLTGFRVCRHDVPNESGPPGR